MTTYPQDPVSCKMPRTARLKWLKQYFLEVLVEDPIDGTLFDSVVLNTIEDLERKFQAVQVKEN
jgi:hypothetical protein